MRDKLQALLAQMHFHGIATALDAELERAEREATPAPELLYRLLCAEAASQRQRSLAYRLHQARLPWSWTLESFPFSQQPSINKAQIKALAGLDFLARVNNIVLSGKTEPDSYCPSRYLLRIPMFFGADFQTPGVAVGAPSLHA